MVNHLSNNSQWLWCFIVSLMIFLIIGIVIYIIYRKKQNSKDSFDGLANRANMLRCNTFQLLADKYGCDDCVKQATKMMANPYKRFDKKCKCDSKKEIPDLIQGACSNLGISC